VVWCGAPCCVLLRYCVWQCLVVGCGSACSVSLMVRECLAGVLVLLVVGACLAAVACAVLRDAVVAVVAVSEHSWLCGQVACWINQIAHDGSVA
jgi:hypothetical protein